MPGAGALVACKHRQRAGKKRSARMWRVYRGNGVRAMEVYRITLPVVAGAFMGSASWAPVAQLDRAAVF